MVQLVTLPQKHLMAIEAQKTDTEGVTGSLDVRSLEESTRNKAVADEESDALSQTESLSQRLSVAPATEAIQVLSTDSV